jgi:protein-tyrosine phosphatase
MFEQFVGVSALKDVFWIIGESSPGLAIVLRPRGNDWLEDELLRFERNGVNVLVSLLEEAEEAELGLSEEGAIAKRIGLSYVSFPIPDRHVPPDLSSFRSFAMRLATRLRTGERIGVHCRGSIGRASITAACALIHLGWRPEAALKAIANARGCAIPDTTEQRDWILRYEVGS